MTTYPVNEIFETIQGEAAYTGTPSVFLRLQGCPVGCAWCDTKHTWDVLPSDVIPIATMTNKVEDEPTYSNMTTEDVLRLLNDFKARHIVITGGEPCLYDLTELCDALTLSGYSVQIETSGTHEIKTNDATWVTVSPKIGMKGGYEIVPTAIARANEIKFPIGKQADVDLLQNLIAYYKIKVPVWLQPLSQSPKATQLCIDKATAHGWKLSIQTHKFLGIR